MNKFWSDLLTYLSSVGTVVVILATVGKGVFDKFLDSRIEKYKGELNKNIESYKAHLAITQIERQVKYTKLYENRGDRIELLYNMLYELERKLQYMTSIHQGPGWANNRVREEEVRMYLPQIKNVLEKNRIYFEEKLCKQIEKVCLDSLQVVIKMEKAKSLEEQRPNLSAVDRGYDASKHDPLQIWSEAEATVGFEIRNARLTLANEFRELIGVNIAN